MSIDSLKVIIDVLLTIFYKWWWLIIPILIYPAAKALYMWWIRWEVWWKEQDWMLLELVPPSEVERPFRGMEDVLGLLWAVIDIPNWREVNCKGEIPLGGGGWITFEIVSLGGDVHFYIRIPRGFRRAVESSIYSQFPQAEIFEAEDYTKNVPRDVPNDKYGFYCEDIVSLRQGREGQDYYPIKTYTKFFEEKPDLDEERRVDPMNSILEHMVKLSPGEQFWLQINCNPIVDGLNYNWVDKAREKINQIARRAGASKGKVRQKSMIEMILDEFLYLIRGIIQVIGGHDPTALSEDPVRDAERERGLSPAAAEDGEKEMLLTPRERHILSAIEDKISKTAFQVWIKSAYLYKKDEPFFYGNYKIGRSYFNHFKEEDMNGILFWNKTRPRVHYFFKERRAYKRKRNLFLKYTDRLPPKYPDMKTGTFILNTEELATIFHFPMNASELPPEVPRVPIRKEAPPSSVVREE